LVFLEEGENVLCFDDGGDDEGDGSGEGVADLEAGEFGGLTWVLVNRRRPWPSKTRGRCSLRVTL
jgi:hypothetical protein